MQMPGRLDTIEFCYRSETIQEYSNIDDKYHRQIYQHLLCLHSSGPKCADTVNHR